MTEHGIDGMSLAVLLAAVALAGLGVLRWDGLLLRLKEFLEPPAESTQTQTAARTQRIHAPRQLHASDLQHQALQRRPGFHRSGRRH